MSSKDRFLDASRGIAQQLAGTAISHEGRSTWMGSRQHVDEESETLVISYESLGADFYAGTAGVGLFLAEAGQRLDDAGIRRSAREALSFAFDHYAELTGPGRFGLYTGALGVAYAGARSAHALGDPALASRSSALLDALLADLESECLVDVLSGAAAAIPALLVMADGFGRDDLVAAAASLGDRVIRSATRGDAGWSWGESATGIESARDLTGFSHGAAGVGYGMVELYRRTGEERFLECARAAFAYENHWFLPDVENWPDFREEDGAEEPAPCVTTWCHGAPGIALSRLVAVQAIGGDDAMRDLRAATRTTKRALQAPHAPDADFSLCHGRAGLAECLLLIADAAGDDEARDIATATAHQGLDFFGDTPPDWPCGVRRGSNPSLMLGLAGIGYFYLRLADPSLPSALLVRPDVAPARAPDRRASRASAA
jgi:lantibiotic biosynthesis protein